jgi:hypothetical protein
MLLNMQKDDATAGDIFSDIAMGLYSYVLDSSYVSGLTQLTNKYGGQKSFLQRTAASFVPYSSFWRSVNKAYEALTEGDVKARESGSWLGALAQVIPGLSSKVPAKLNVWGEEVVIEGGVFRQWLPYKAATETDDPLEKELESLEMYPKLPNNRLRVYPNDKTTTELPEGFYRDYCIHFGNKLHTRLSKIIGSEGYQRVASPERRAEML